jgi:hypothetical protein
MWQHLFTSKHFRWGLILTIVGAAGTAVFGIFGMAALQYFGPLTLPYTAPIFNSSRILLFGSLPLAELIALVQWELKPKQKSEEMKVPAQANLVFVDHEATLVLGNMITHLPPMKNEHFFCRAMFKHRVNEPVDWSVPYEEMTGNEKFPPDHEKAKRMVYDTYDALNKRVKHDLSIDRLFVWEGNTVKRTR